MRAVWTDQGWGGTPKNTPDPDGDNSPRNCPHGPIRVRKILFLRMSGFMGADTEQLRGFGDGVTAGAATLQDRVETALAQALAANWQGSDADEFRSRCDSARAQLQDVLDTLRARAKEAAEHADEQDSASGTGGGGFGGGGPFSGPGGPFQDVIDLFESWGSDTGGNSPADRARRWSDIIGEEAYDRTVDLIENAQSVGEDLRKSRLWNFGKKAIPVLPDLWGIGKSALAGDPEAVFWKSNRAAVEAIPAVSIVDAISGEFLAHAPDDWTVGDTDIRWKDGTALDGVEKYMIERSREFNLTQPGEDYAGRVADRWGIDNTHARNLMETAGGLGFATTFNSPPSILAGKLLGTDGHEWAWKQLNRPFD